MMNSENCVNAVSFEVFRKNRLKTVPHSHPFKVPWTNSKALGVKQKCFIPVNFYLYYWKTLWHMLGTKSMFSTASNQIRQSKSR